MTKPKDTFEDLLHLLEEGGRLDYEDFQAEYNELVQRLSHQLDLVDNLVQEFQDALSFMETFEDMPEGFGDEGTERLQSKERLLKAFLKS